MLMKNGVVVGGWIEMRLFVATVFWGLMMKEIKNHMKFLDLFAGIGGFRLGLQGSHLFSDLNIYCLRTSKDSSTMTEELHLKPSSEPWMNWGTMWNGKSLTARILEYPKTENGCSLSDILEENVPEEFFLSQKVASKLIQSKSSTAIPLQPDMATHKEQGRTLLKVNRRK